LSQILEIFFVVHDATTLNRQGNDTGTQYRSGIYCSSDDDKQAANDMIRQMSQDKLFASPIVTEVLPLANYWTAEAYHQDFFENNPNQGYCVAVAGPKVAKFRKTFASLVND
jgi:peptide-methionine (S)-S-oxide reductase